MNFTDDVLERFPSAKPGLLAIDSDGARYVWSFGELIARSAGLSGALVARGVRREGVVMTVIGNRAEWVLAMLACFRIGAVALPVNTQLRRRDFEHRIAAADPKLVIADERYAGELPDRTAVMSLAEVSDVLDEDAAQAPPAEPVDLDANDPAVITFTSGTTGEARGALQPQRYLTGQLTQAERWFGAGPDELAWCTAATGWSKSARNCFIAPWLCGAAALVHDARFDPAERLDICERESVAVLCQSPTEYRMLAKHAELREMDGLRRLVSAGEPLNPEVIRKFEERVGIGVHDGYGQTETGAIAGALVGDPIRPGSMGRALPGIDVRIEDNELQLRAASSPTFFDRYLDSDPFEDEWWPTGDQVSEDEDGYLWYQGRSDDLIVSAGYRIGPFEVESALVSHPAVAEAAAVAAPDDERGSVVRAVVVLRDGEPGPDLVKELQEHAKRETAPYKYPRVVDFADELPKTPSGKIKRAALRDSG